MLPILRILLFIIVQLTVILVCVVLLWFFIGCQSDFIGIHLNKRMQIVGVTDIIMF